MTLLHKKDFKHEPVAFKQKSSAVAEEEALPGPAPGQDGEPDRQPGAHGEERRSWWSCCVRIQTNSSSLFCFSQVQDLEFAQIERKVIEGLKVGNDCLKKMHEVGGGTFCLVHHQLCVTVIEELIGFPTLGDVGGRSRTDYGRNSRRHRIPEGKSPTGVKTQASSTSAQPVSMVTLSHQLFIVP